MTVGHSVSAVKPLLACGIPQVYGRHGTRKAKHPGRSRGVCKRYVASELFFERVGIGQILR